MRLTIGLLVAVAAVADGLTLSLRSAPQTALLSARTGKTGPIMNLIDMLSGKGRKYAAPCVMGDESIMNQKAHGTSETPVQDNLRWNCARDTADNICNFNRHYAEYSGYWERATTFLKEESMTSGPITFYDSNTGEALFTAPVGRSWDAFVKESRQHGWPSFRDDEVNWDLVRVLPNGECVSTAGTHVSRPGTHIPRPPPTGIPTLVRIPTPRTSPALPKSQLGHNLPDMGGRNRYCINLVSVAGRPVK